MCTVHAIHYVLYVLFTMSLTGIGSCGLCLCPVIVIQQNFSKRYAFPMGIYLFMSSIGGVVGAPLLEILSTYYGWRGALVILSAVVMNTVACGLIYRETRSTDDDEAKHLFQKSRSLITCKHTETCPSDDESEPLCREVSNSTTSRHNLSCSQETDCNKNSDGNDSDNDPTCHIINDSNEMPGDNGYDTFTQSSEEDQITKACWLARHIDYQLLLQPVFICYLLSRLLCRSSGVVMYQYTPSKAVADGSSEIEASFLSSIGNVLMILGRMASTFISSSDHVNRYVFYAVTTLLGAVLSLGYSFSRNYVSNLISVAAICVFSGEYTSELPLLYTFIKAGAVE